MTASVPNRALRGAEIVSLCAATTTVAGGSYVFFHDFPRVLEVVDVAGMESTHTLLGFIFPFLWGLAMVSAVLWAAAAVGFRRGRRWTAAVVAGAAMTGMIATFMPIPPTAGRGHLFPSTLVSSLPVFLAAFVVTARGSLRLPWRTVLLGAGGVVAGLWCFINGTASTHRILDGHGLAYLVAQCPHWILVFGWFDFVACSFAGRPRVRATGVAVASATALFGLPVAVVDALFLGRFSLFGVSPIWALAILVALWVASWQGVGPGPGRGRDRSQRVDPGSRP